MGWQEGYLLPEEQEEDQCAGGVRGYHPPDRDEDHAGLGGSVPRRLYRDVLRDLAHIPQRSSQVDYILENVGQHPVGGS